MNSYEENIDSATETVLAVQLDAVNYKITASASVLLEIQEHFEFFAPGYRYMPAYRNRMWDGKIRLFSVYASDLPTGLISTLKEFCRKRGYALEEKSFPRLPVSFKTDDEYRNFLLNLKPCNGDGNPFVPEQHQIDGFQIAIQNQRATLLSPTGSGKSFLIYGLSRYYHDVLEKTKTGRILIIVPTQNLVYQLRSDFTDYSTKNGWSVDQNVQIILQGHTKDLSKPIVISTWQSCYNMPKEWFKDFGMIIGDECHLTKSKSLTKIFNNMKHCYVRFGTTGTLDNSKIHSLMIQGLIGPIFQVTTTDDLIKKDFLSKIQVYTIYLQYPEVVCKFASKLKYDDEIQWLLENENRNNRIVELVDSVKGNTLILTSRVDGHILPLERKLREKIKEREIFITHQGVPVSERERIRKYLDSEHSQDCILVATYNMLSTGINIRNLHNIVLAYPSKSKIRVLQSIGRQLRKSQSKKVAKLLDIVDDMRYKSKTNTTFDHFVERLGYYIHEKFPIQKLKMEVYRGSSK